MLDILLKTAFYLAAGFVLVVASVWYARSLYGAVTGTGDVVIVPFAVAGVEEDKDKTRGTALARMLQAHLQEIENGLASSQRELMEEHDNAQRASLSTAQISAIIPRLFVEQGASLQTKLLEPAQINVAVGGVQVGGILPWLQRLLANRRSLEFSFYEGDAKVSVAGSLQVLGMSGESLRVELDKSAGAKVDWNDVTAEVAYEIIWRRLARDASNRVQVLNRGEFRTLITVMGEIVRLNRNAALGRPVRGAFGDELKKIEPLVRAVPEWHQLNMLAASIAESADDKNKALDFYRNVQTALKKTIPKSDTGTRRELEKILASANAKIEQLQSVATVAATLTENAALELIRADAQAAAQAYNTIFGVQLQPPPVQLLSKTERNAYYDGKAFNAPPLVAKISAITYHAVAWQYLEKYVPTLGPNPGLEASTIMYSYSDVLPMFLKQKGLVGGQPTADWTLYAGGVAWVKGGDEKAIASDPRPLRSFESPGNAYEDPEIGKDPQIGHIKDLTSTTFMVSGAGIGNKAFYETAKLLGVDRAWAIWFEGLKQLAKEKKVTFRKWGQLLLAAAGDDRDNLLRALKTVGISE